MTVLEALDAIRQVGTAENDAGNLKLRFPDTAASGLAAAINTLRERKAEALALLSDPGPAELARACDVLNAAGVRIMRIDDALTIGLWANMDEPEVRAALHTLEVDCLPIRYLDEAGIPERYKVRRVILGEHQ